MKTQINTLRSGKLNQRLNPNVDYSKKAITTSSGMPSGSPNGDVSGTWKKITDENPEHLTIKLFGEEIKLTANWSLSRKSVSYDANLDREFVEKHNFVVLAKNTDPYISIQLGNIVEIGNGKNSYMTVCPSFVEIL